MKLRAAAWVLFGACLVSSGAQAAGPIELTPHVGVQIGGFATQGNRNIDIETGVSYGFAADYRTKPYLYLRAGYHRVATSALIWTAPELTASSIPLSQGHLLLGATYEHSFGRVRVDLGVGAGATHFTPHSQPADASIISRSSYGEEWYGVGAVEAALKVGIVENLGARVHARLLMTPMPGSSPLFCPDARRACDFNFGSNVLAQSELGVGVSWAF